MSRIHRTLVSYAVVVVLVAVAAWFALAKPISPQPVTAGPPTTTSSATSANESGSTTADRTTALRSSGPGSSSPGRSSGPSPSRQPSCVAGQPVRMVIPSLGVDAPFERIGLDTSAPVDSQGRHPLGNPKDRTRAGWYSDGPEPGSGRGTVLTNGHTYRNNSAIFKEDFASRVAVGQVITIVNDNGSKCAYRIQRVWREVNAARDYPGIVSSQHLYDFDGPERLFLATCGGSWNSSTQNYDDISLLIANPVGRQ